MITHDPKTCAVCAQFLRRRGPVEHTLFDATHRVVATAPPVEIPRVLTLAEAHAAYRAQRARSGISPAAEAPSDKL